VLTRRTTHRRDRAAARLHVLEGLLAALDHLDAVVALIRAADSADSARGELMARYRLSEVQATAVLDLPLRRLAALERRRLADERRELGGRIDELEAILADSARLDALLAEELAQLKARHASPRRTRVGPPAGAGTRAGDGPVRLDPQPVTVYVTAGGGLNAVPPRRVSRPHAQPRDPLAAVVRSAGDGLLLLVDAAGGGCRVAVDDVPVTGERQRPTPVAQLLGSAPGAAVVAAVLLEPSAETVLTVSAGGLVKRTHRREYEGRARTMVVAGVRRGDTLAAAAACNDGDHVLVAHDGGRAIRFPAAEVRPTGRAATGVAGLRVPAGRRVVAVSVVPAGHDDDRELLALSRDGRATRLALAGWPLQRRGGKGVRCSSDELAWFGLAADLHVPLGEQWVVLRPAAVAAGDEPGQPAPAAGAVVGNPVVETGGPALGRGG
ncbi:MAG TPA: DNA gyrase subunit A, partial [Egibacteraceae bacterium]|nr:DNA gyrase subunit A [Egibacteraceae bacterium]